MYCLLFSVSILIKNIINININNINIVFDMININMKEEWYGYKGCEGYNKVFIYCDN